MKTIEILIAEDDKKLNEGICLALQNEGILFTRCYSCREIRGALSQRGPDLILLDINFADGSGLDILRDIRLQKLPIKVLLLTANNQELDVVTGLELGADDYITKPFSLMVLRARVNVQLRALRDGISQQRLEGTVQIADFSFDFDKMLFCVKNEPVELSKTEQKLLRLLVEHRPATVTREKLIDSIWNGDSDYVDGHALTVSVKRLRSKLGDDGPEPQYIKTVYGIGYTWAVKV